VRATIDPADRLVIPKPLRQRLALLGGQLVEVVERDGRIEIEVLPTPMALAEGDAGLVAVPAVALVPLTDAVVRAVMERTRRAAPAHGDQNG
jgi:AbrB family looped-hinge helix DNA binding protein